MFAALSADGSTMGAIAIPGIPRQFGNTPRSAELRRQAIAWNVADGSIVNRFDMHGKYLPTHVALSPEGALLLTSGFSGASAPSILRHIDGGTSQFGGVRGGTFSADGRIIAAVHDITKGGGPAFPLFGLPIPPPPMPKIRLLQADARSGRQLLSREVRTSDSAHPLAWMQDLSWFIDRELRLWKLPK